MVYVARMLMAGRNEACPYGCCFKVPPAGRHIKRLRRAQRKSKAEKAWKKDQEGT